jgi:hypothetical protein
MCAQVAQGSEQFLRFVAFDLADRRARVEHVRFRIDERDAVAAVFDERAEAVLALAQRVQRLGELARACGDPDFELLLGIAQFLLDTHAVGDVARDAVHQVALGRGAP